MTITDERYVSFTTFRRSGEAVSTPVWIVALPDGRCGFTTNNDSGKAKRLRNDPRATLRPCDRSGNVADGAPETAVQATMVSDGPDVDAVRAALVAKYGVLARLLNVGSSLRGLGRHIGRADTSGAVVATLPEG